MTSLTIQREPHIRQLELSYAAKMLEISVRKKETKHEPYLRKLLVLAVWNMWKEKLDLEKETML